jgi:hypothetical protein
MDMEVVLMVVVVDTGRRHHMYKAQGLAAVEDP